MNKRRFLQGLLATGAISLMPAFLERQNQLRLIIHGKSLEKARQNTPPGIARVPSAGDAELLVEPVIDNAPPPPPEQDLMPGFQHHERQTDLADVSDREVDEYLEKIRNFDADFLSDVYLPEEKMPVLLSTVARLDRVQSFVGHGNFNLLGFDEMLFFARNYEAIGGFEQAEKDLLEEVFSNDATRYGFFGDKVITRITHAVPHDDIEKIVGSGHYLYKGESLNLYKQIRRDVGPNLTLTSGVRNVVKQMHLFLAKAVTAKGNLSKASRSLAPPGYSYHGIGDFDVGKAGLGERNFTSHFSSTPEFERMIRLGYVDIRYTDTNRFGVRYEPWHVKMV